MAEQQHKYRYKKTAGALQENVAPSRDEASGEGGRRAARPMANNVSIRAQSVSAPVYQQTEEEPNFAQQMMASEAARLPHGRALNLTNLMEPPAARPATAPSRTASLDTTRRLGSNGMFQYTVEEGQHVLVVSEDGTMEEVVGPRRIWRWGKTIRAMEHHVAHPGEFLLVKFRDGRQEHLAGPSHVWVDPRLHLGVEKEDALQIASKESVVVYARSNEGSVTRRIVDGPAVFVPAPGEWLHTFSWHGSAGDGTYKKVPNALVFQKLWRLPDQMYHDVEDVRTADDAVLTIKLMLFFELLDVEMMLATTHDPIGDFLNAATSDVVDYLARLTFDGFKRATEKLNDLSAYPQLASRATQCGYRINKVVYRGYGLPRSLQAMHDQALESRTRLNLERETQQQAQELEDFTLDRALGRAERQRTDQASAQMQELDLARQRQEQHRTQGRLDEEQALQLARARSADQRAHLEALRGLGVDLTSLLTQGRADQVIELRGEAHGAHVHLGQQGSRG